MQMTSNKGCAPLPRRGRGGRTAFLLKRVFIPGAVMLLGLLLAAAPALADKKGQLTLNLKTEKEIIVKDEKGKRKIKRVDLTKVNAVPGDEVILTLTYKNIGKEKAVGVKIDYPIPEKMLYKADSAEGKGTKITFSVDKGKKYGPPGKLTVVNAEGKVVPAEPKDYTHIRWALTGSVAPGKSGKVVFRTFVK